MHVVRFSNSSRCGCERTRECAALDASDASSSSGRRIRGCATRAYARTPPRLGRRPRARAGLTFVEVLFAVIVLGIGFIMIAGIFPVAISQTQSNVDETVASTRRPRGGVYAGAGTIASIFGTNALPTTGGGQSGTSAKMFSFHDAPSPTATTISPLWAAVRGNVILPEDRVTPG